jgi:hypothetical protein
MANAVSPSSPTRQHRMTVQDQNETVTFLKATGLRLSVETVSTHISVVVLGGDRALKLKRAVRFPYRATAFTQETEDVGSSPGLGRA